MSIRIPFFAIFVYYVESLNQITADRLLQRKSFITLSFFKNMKKNNFYIFFQEKMKNLCVSKKI